MTTAVNAQERRRDLKETVDALIERRQKTLEAWCNLCGCSDPEQTNVGNIPDIAPVALKEFLDIMVDYTAMGQFTVYQRIIDGQERRKSVQAAAEAHYPAVGATTDSLVEFNDRYERFSGASDDQAELKVELARLGETLAIRGELEDKILDALTAK